MAAASDVESDKLNFILKILAEAGLGDDRMRTDQISSTQRTKRIFRTPEKHITAQLYGSAAEGLKRKEFNDWGDHDIMIFPESDDLIIHDELLEYSLENPLHVKIKGGDHPVLQSCLVEGTEYVATSALKNFHPEIFGYLSAVFIEILCCLIQTLSRNEFSSLLHCTPVINSPTSPALTANFGYNAIDTMLEHFFKLKDQPLNLPIINAAEIEFIVVAICLCAGVPYTTQVTEILDAFSQFWNEMVLSLRKINMFTLLQAARFKRVFPTRSARFQEVITLVMDIIDNTMHNDAQLLVTPEESDEEQNRRYINNSAKQQNCDVDQMLKNFKAFSLMSDDFVFVNFKARLRELIKRHLQEEAVHNQQIGTPTKHDEEQRDIDSPDCPGVSLEIFSEIGGSLDKLVTRLHDIKNESNTEREPLEQMEMVASKDPPSNPNGKEEEDEKKALASKRIENRILRHVLGIGTGPMGAQIREREFRGIENEQSHEGMKWAVDFVPAFRSRGWPKVAREWVKRQRKWPSPHKVNKVIQEGFHLVVKPPKNNDHPECDFRISFSHAEYLLSQEMNDIQRECYLCLKRYHRAYLSTQPKTLVSFHLKNIFLQTLEETDGEMWTESNRAECMMRLLGNLLTALTKKDLPHYFVQSYNLFGEDYIENPKILESLAWKVEQILGDPMKFSEQLVQEEDNGIKSVISAIWNVAEKCILSKIVPSSQSTLSAKPAKETSHEKIEEATVKSNDDTRLKNNEATVPSLPTEANDLKDIYQSDNEHLVDMAVNDAKCRLEPLVHRFFVEKFREFARKCNISAEALPEFFNVSWPEVFAKPAKETRQEKIEEVPIKGNDDTQLKSDKATAPSLPTKATQGSNVIIEGYRYHDLKDIYQEVTKQLVDMAFNDAECRLETLDPLDRSLVVNLREFARKHNIPVEALPDFFNANWSEVIYLKIWSSTEPDLWRRMLVAIQGLLEHMKYLFKQDDFREAKNKEAVDAFYLRVLDPATENPLDLNHIIPPGILLDCLQKFFGKVFQLLYGQLFASPQKLANNMNEIPLD